MTDKYAIKIQTKYFRVKISTYNSIKNYDKGVCLC